MTSSSGVTEVDNRVDGLSDEKEVLKSKYKEIKAQFDVLDAECSRLERAEQNHESEIQEYHDFLESLADFLIWDTGKRAREARYKIEAFLKKMDQKYD